MKSFILTLKLAVRNLGRQRQRTLSTLAAIVVGLVGLAFLDGYISYSMWGLKETIIRSGTGHFQVAASAAYFDEGDSDPFPYLLPDSNRLANQLRRLPEVKEVVPSLAFQAVLGVGAKMETIRIQAMPTALRLANLEMLKVRSGTDLDPDVPGRILLGTGLASKLGLAPGDTVTIFALASGGGVNNQEFIVSGTASSGIAAADASSAFLDLGDAQGLLGTDRVPLLTVYLDHTEDTDAVLARLRQHAPAAAPTGVVFRGWDELSPYYRQANGSYQMVLGVARIIVLLVALFSISGTLNLSVLERLREIGTLRAFGTRRGGVIRLLVSEGTLLGVLGAVAGTLVGWAATAAFNLAGGVTMPTQPGMTEPLTIFFRPDPGHALANGLWVIAAAVGSWFPAHLATRRLPADLLRAV